MNDEPTPLIAPFGSWPSPISASSVTNKAVRLGEPRVEGDLSLWTERRTAEGSRTYVCVLDTNNNINDLTGSNDDVHSTVHEYGGSSYCLTPLGLCLANAKDQSWWLATEPEHIRLTPEDASVRLGEAIMHPDGISLIAVREEHTTAVENDLVRVALDGSGITSLHSGHDFYGAPTISPDGKRIAFCTWDHPQMPWDGTNLHIGEVAEDGSITSVEVLAGSETESVQQPLFSNDGLLHYVSDRSGWWNIYSELSQNSICAMNAEFGLPAWQQDYRTFDFLSDGRIACTWQLDAISHLGVIEPNGELTQIETEFLDLGTIRVTHDDKILTVASGATRRASVVHISLDGTVEVLSSSGEIPDAPWTSIAQPITFDGPAGPTHALFYAPNSPTHIAPDDELPPLLVWSHGGPTGSTSPGYNPAVQYWTSRGYAIVDVNYSGSTGYGREYRNRLRKNWGVLDAADCIAAANHLAESGIVDRKRMLIEGGSAGGYTTLCALVFHDVFAAGVSRYGVADVELLALDTHKFESRYLDSLIGPYPEAADIYRERSPINFTDQLSAPMLLLQGGKDKVVPPSQAEKMIEALDEASLTYAYILFEEEPHGFRLQASIVKSLQAQEVFMAAVFDIDPAEELPILDIKNL